MATDKDSTLQDVLLELMVANETLDKIEKNNASLIPLLTRDSKELAVAAESDKGESEAEEKKSPIYACCEAIHASVNSMVAGLAYLARFSEEGNSLLVQVRNNLMGMRNDLEESRKASGLTKLQSLENTAEAKKTQAAPTPTATRRPAIDVGNISFGQTVAALAGMLTGFITGLVVELTKMVTGTLKILTGPLKKLVIVLADSISGAFTTVATKLKAIGRLTEFKLEPLIAPIIKWFKSIQVAGKMMLAAKLGKYLDPILDAFDLIKADAKVASSKLGSVASKFFGSISSTFAKVTASAAEWAKPLRSAFGEFFVEMKKFWTALTDLRPEKLYRSFLKLFPDLVGASDPVATAIKAFAKRLSTFPAAIGNWIQGLKTAFNVGKTIGTVISKLAGPLTLIMSMWDAITGAIDGFTKTEGNVFKKLIGAFKGGVSNLLRGLIGAPADLLKSLISWFAGLFGKTGKKIEKFLDSFSFADVIEKLIGGIIDGGKAIFMPMMKLLSVVVENIGKLGETFSLLKFLPKAFTLFSTVIGKIALPLQILLSVFDGVTGFIDGFTKTEGSLLDKIVGGLKGMVSGIINGLIGGLLDLLKDGISWLARSFGWDGIADALDSFKFTDIITEMVSNLFDSLVGYFKDTFAGISEIVSGIKDLFSGKIDFFTFVKKALAGLITGILAPFNFISKLAGFNLTDKILELLGLPKAGASTQAQPEATAAAPASAATPAPSPATTTAAPALDFNDPDEIREQKAIARLTSKATTAQIVNPQENLSTANNTGAMMAAQQNQTNELNSTITAAPVMAPAAAAAPSVNTSTVNSVVYNNTNIPDRTQSYMVPAFGY